jgi:hypothetical protein
LHETRGGASPKDAGSGSGSGSPCTGSNGLLRLTYYSPIVVDLDRGGFAFTGLEDGVWFDLDADGAENWVAWIDEEVGDAFLVLDRNFNGRIDDASELFGSFTQQPPSDEPNGYRALAVFDQPEYGGNGDGLVSDADAIFVQLRLWVDVDHDGVSQIDELSTAMQHDITAFDLSFVTSNRRDRHGNLLHFKSKAYLTHGGVLQTTDVFLLGYIPFE